MAVSGEAVAFHEMGLDDRLLKVSVFCVEVEESVRFCSI